MGVAEQPRLTQNLLVAIVALQVIWVSDEWTSANAFGLRHLPLLLVYVAISCIAIIRLPVSLVSRVRRIWESFVGNEKRLLLTLSLFFLIVGGIYASRHQSLADEAHLFTASKIIAEQGVVTFFADYARIPWLGQQHPPLVPLVFGLAMRVLGMKLFVIRLVSLGFGLAAILLTYMLGNELYDRDTGLLAALAVLSFPFFFRLSAAALTDIPVTVFFACSMLLLLRLLRTPRWRLSVTAGVLTAAGFLSKYTMAFIYPLLFIYIITQSAFRRVKLHLAVVALVPLGILAVWLAYACRHGVLAKQMETVFSYARVGGILRFRHGWVFDRFLTRLPSALGIYNIPLLLFGGVYLLRRMRQSDQLVLLWIATLWLILLFTLPDPRYFALTFPALAIVMARVLRNIPHAEQKVAVLALLYSGVVLYW